MVAVWLPGASLAARSHRAIVETMLVVEDYKAPVGKLRAMAMVYAAKSRTVEAAIVAAIVPDLGDIGLLDAGLGGLHGAHRRSGGGAGGGGEAEADRKRGGGDNGDGLGFHDRFPLVIGLHLTEAHPPFHAPIMSEAQRNHSDRRHGMVNFLDLD